MIGLSARKSGQSIEYTCFGALMYARGWAIHHVLSNCATAPENPECRAALFWLRIPVILNGQSVRS
jgi:hypothetical protein